MSGQILSSRAIIGEYYRQLAADAGIEWVNDISNLFESDQESETYNWLGQVPAMREWLGGRQAKQLREDGFTIINTEYESTLEMLVKHLRRDKTGQMMARIGEQVQRGNTHWASLLSTLIMNGPSTTCYDNQFFFDTDHSEGDSGSQSNDISVDISDLPVETAGIITAPSSEEAKLSALKGINQICSFKDDQGEPLNEMASSFLVMVPLSLYDAMDSGFTTPRGTGLAEQASKKQIKVVANTRLTWTDSFAVFRTDSPIKPLIRQQETDIQVSGIGSGSEYEFQNKAHQYGLYASRGVGYGMWQQACYVTMI